MLLKVEDLKVHFPIKKGILSKTVGYVYAVDGVSFELKKGEILGIAGESGCGKSTFGNSLVLLKPPMKYVGGKVKLESKPGEGTTFVLSFPLITSLREVKNGCREYSCSR